MPPLESPVRRAQGPRSSSPGTTVKIRRLLRNIATRLGWLAGQGVGESDQSRRLCFECGVPNGCCLLWSWPVPSAQCRRAAMLAYLHKCGLHAHRCMDLETFFPASSLASVDTPERAGRPSPSMFAAPTPTPPVPHYMHPPRQTATSPCKAASHATLRYPYTATADAWYSHLMAAQALARAKVKSAWKGRPASTIKPCHLEKRPWICWPSSDPILILSLQPSRTLL